MSSGPTPSTPGFLLPAGATLGPMTRAGIAVVLVLALGGCADAAVSGGGRPAAPSATAPPSAKLAFRVDDGEGIVRRARLECRDQATATGYLTRAPERHCRRAFKLARFLAAKPDPGRVCTQVYGGPQTARVTGRVGERTVDRRFHRADGCAVADWDRMGSLLG